MAQDAIKQDEPESYDVLPDGFEIIEPEPPEAPDTLMETIKQIMSVLPEPLVQPATALSIIIMGWFVAKLAEFFVTAAINRTGIGRKARSTGRNIGSSLAKAAFWLIWLMFILAALSGFEALSGPGKPLASLNGMMEKVFAYLPNLIGAALIGAIGWIVSNVAQKTVTTTLEAVQVDRIADKFNIGRETTGASNTIAKAAGSLVFGVLILLFAREVFNQLGMTDISNMLGKITDYFPEVIGASVILAVSIFIGRFVAKLAEDVLPSLGFDRSLSVIGGLDGESTGSGIAPSKIVGVVAFVGITLMGLVAFFNALGIDQLTNIFETVLEFGSRITIGAIIIGAGFFIANFISRLVSQTSGDLAGRIIKYITIVLVTFMGLSQMGIGGPIVDTAFRYGIGAIAFAAGIGGALAFGLGGRDWAKTKLADWFPTPTPKTRARKK